MYFKGLTFIFSEDPPENHLLVIGGLLLKYYVLLLLLLFSSLKTTVENSTLGTLCLGRCPKESFHLIYALAVKVVYVLNSANRSVKCKGQRSLLLLVQAKCAGKLS